MGAVSRPDTVKAAPLNEPGASSEAASLVQAGGEEISTGNAWPLPPTGCGPSVKVHAGTATAVTGCSCGLRASYVRSVALPERYNRPVNRPEPHTATV